MESIYHTRAREIADLVASKQEAYGDAFGQSHRVLEVLYPNGVSGDQMQDFLAVVRLVDKMFRIANKKEAFGEDPWKDIAGYALLSLCKGQIHAVKVFDNIKKDLTDIVVKAKISGRKTRPKAGRQAGRQAGKEGIVQIRKRLAILEMRGRLSENQRRALKETKGIHAASLTAEQEGQIKNIYHDVISGEIKDRYSAGGKISDE